jgi:GTP-binding protein
MPVPQVVIVGRPNVGKSSLLNWLTRRLTSVVDPMAGVTRDRVMALLHAGERYFELVDTGGMGIVDSDDLTEDIERQIEIGLSEADLILFVVDGQAGVTPLDKSVAERLRKIDKPKLLVINKCDSPRLDAEIHEFRGLCEGPLVVTSVKAQRNRDELLAAILQQLPPADEHEATEGTRLGADPELKLAIVGRRNVGKSTFINALADEERVIVSEVPGTTRDSIDVRFEIDGKTVIAIDTPGVRKRKSLANDVEFYGLVRAKRSIRRADVVLMFFDSQDTISRVDKQLAHEIFEQFKPCIFVVNKWDLAQEMTTAAWTEYLLREFSSLRHAPVAFLTAQENRNVKKVVNLAQSIFKQARTRIATAELNEVVRAALKLNSPPTRKNRRAKILYATQVAVEPPTIVLKCNDPSLFDEAWKRYLLGVLREALPFKEVPIKLIFRSRLRDDGSVPNLEEVES